jgi:hypothetical protein
MILQLYTEYQTKLVRVRTCSRRYVGNIAKNIGPGGPILESKLIRTYVYS